MSLFFLILSSCFASAIEPKAMNGISFDEYWIKTKNYSLVTVRYRTDKDEQRYTYANKKAFQGLSKNGEKYPDGSVFTKVGVMVGEDPHFTSSKIPRQAKRFQVMVKDNKKYASTDGWGYAVFSLPEGAPEPESVATALACHACHQLVSSKDYVFSVPFDPLQEKKQILEASPLSKKYSFVSKPLSSHWPRQLKFKVMDSQFIDLFQGPLEASSFWGTLGELKPALSAQSYISRKPALYINGGQDQIAVVMPMEILIMDAKEQKKCQGKQKLFFFYRAEYDRDGNVRVEERDSYCYAPIDSKL